MLAGYLASIEQWGKFSDSWKAVCLEPRPIQFFKSNHAEALKRQFAGWSSAERDFKVSRLAKIVAEPEALVTGLGVHMCRKDFTEVAQGQIADAYKDPYFLCVLSVVLLTVSFVTVMYPLGVERIDFILDKQSGLNDTFKNFFDTALRPRYSILGECLDLDDRDCLPLQAADMNAWRIRQTQARIEWATAATDPLMHMPQLTYNLTRSLLVQLARRADEIKWNLPS